VVALMSELSAQPVKTCAIGFDVAALDETSYAAQIAGQFGTDHRSRTVASDDFGAIDQLAAMFDEPFADASALPTWRVCQLAREDVTVALSGDGADEAFAGYRRQVFHHHEERARSVLPAALRRPVFGTLGRLWPKADWAPRPLRAKATLLALGATGEEGYARGHSVTTPQQRAALYSESFARQLGGARAEDELIALMRAAPARSGLDRAQYADLAFWLPGDILTKVDRTSMAVGLEAREPLLDHRLVEFAARLPEALRVSGRTGKYLLKRAMEPHLPRDILYRPKQGFVTPIADWLRGPLAGAARGIATGPLAETDWFDPHALGRLAEAHISGSSDTSRVLWQMLMLERSVTRLGISA
jgi:asparagine synthase (glutamine-hydrolysing)